MRCKIVSAIGGIMVCCIGAGRAEGGHTRNIMLTGYWPPTNEMLRPFSTNPDQNPGGWIGENWEGRGYNVYAFFPECGFPVCEGDFEVDYQDTSEDWWRITAEVNPVGIITTSRGGRGRVWEIEYNQYNRAVWIDDYVPPYQPTPAPPDDSVPPGTRRVSTLPVEEIRDAVIDANLGLSVFDTCSSPVQWALAAPANPRNTISMTHVLNIFSTPLSDW